MATLSQAQVAMYAQSAGMSNPVLMSAIAMAESSGNTNAHNPLGLDDSYGLWQINMLGSMGPARRAQFGISSNSQLYDPATNARAAAKILGEQGLGAWSTYTNGAYKKFVPKVTTATNASTGAIQAGNWWDPFVDGFKKGFDVGPGPEDLFDGGTSNDPSLKDIPGVSGLGDVAKNIGTVAEGVMKAGKWLGDAKNWLRVAYVVGGSALVGIGLYIVAAPVIGSAVASAPSAQAIKGVVGKSKAAPKKESAA